MITNKYKAKKTVKHISCKCKFNSTTGNPNQNEIIKHVICKCNNYRTCKKDYSWNLNICICENGKYLKSIADD